jgi:cytoskeletal protein CcmA (bactofilin family)
VDTSGTLIISEKGEIIANIEAGIVICKGQVKGNVTATQKVEMHPSSKITGNVKSPSLSIEIGAKVEGSIDMSNKIAAAKISLDAP